MRIFLSLVLALSACGVDPVTTDPENTSDVQVPSELQLTAPEIGLCGDRCSTGVQCGGALCHVCAGFPGTGMGTCLTATPFGMVDLDAER